MRKLLVIGAVVAAFALSACGGGSKTNAGASDSNGSKSSSAANASSFDQVAAKQQITDAITLLFDGTNPDNEAKLQTLEDPEKARNLFFATINDPTLGAEQKLATATVTDIQFTDDTHANVTFTINLSGNPALAGRTGTATVVNGKWKVTDSTFCDVTSLGNPAANNDPACQ